MRQLPIIEIILIYIYKSLILNILSVGDYYYLCRGRAVERRIL